VKVEDYLIIGQGISGSLLSIRLKRLGYKIRLIDEINPNSASRVAAGIWHPMVFKRLTQSWMADQFIPEAESTYVDLEQLTNTSFFYPKPYYRLLNEVSDCNDWDTKSSELHLQSWMANTTELTSTMIQPHEGIGQVLHGGYLDTEGFLLAIRTYLKEDLLDERYEDAQLEVLENAVVYQTHEGEKIKAQKIIFANGVGALETNWFNWVPFQPVKGEVITIFSPQLKQQAIISRGVFVCPIGNHRYNVGATYNWRELNEYPTDEGKEELMGKLNEILSVPYDVVEHKAGVRPAVRGRRPLLGEHPTNNRVLLFNGMGSKAVLMAPYLAKHMVEHLTQGNPLLPEIDLKRFYSFYS